MPAPRRRHLFWLCPLTFVALSAAPLFAQPSAPPTPVSDLLRAEARQMQSSDQTRWSEYEARVEHVLSEHRRMVAKWMKRMPPPPPDIASLNLPLPYLVWKFEHSEPPQGAFATAIAASSDPRRIDYLLEQHPRKRIFTTVVVAAMTAERAPGVIRNLLSQRPKLRENELTHRLMQRFAVDLPEPLRKECYDYIRTNWPHGPSNGPGAEFWRTLLKLDGDRARRELARYLTEPTDRLYVVRVLYEFPGRSDEVAAAARQVLKQRSEIRWIEPHLRMVLLCADPDRELQPYVAHLDSLLTQTDESGRVVGPQRRPVNSLVTGLLERVPQRAIAALRRYVTDTRVRDIVRFHILEYLVRQRDPYAEDAVRAWLASPRSHLRIWVRDNLGRWGDHGRELAERLLPTTSGPSQP